MKHHTAALSAASAALGSLGGMLGIAWYVSSKANPLPRRRYIDYYTFTPWEMDVPFEDITLHTPDGLTLHGWWLPRPAARSVVIGCHGHEGRKDDLLGIGTGLWRAGHNVLLFDMRGRGENVPWPNTLAAREVDDLLTAVAYTRERLPTAKIGVIGFSMGAAVALLAAARNSDIAAVLADSPFTGADDVIAFQMRQKVLFAEELLPLVDAMVARRYGYRLSQVRPLDVVARLAPRPLLLVHASHDTMIPVAHAYRIFTVAQHPKELWIAEGIEHCGAYFDDRQQYVERAAAFFGQYLTSIE
jgi:fermentation-respiration switch protein FrsA (DUF1100 family)